MSNYRHQKQNMLPTGFFHPDGMYGVDYEKLSHFDEYQKSVTVFKCGVADGP